MRAIVLTFDKQIGLAELTYKKYMELWSDCPFTFRIAYNDKDNIPNSLKNKENVNMVKTAVDIRSTMAGLLEGIPDDEWIYWCIDDRYPIYIDTDSMQSVYDFTQSEEAADLNSIKLLNWKERHLKHRNSPRIGGNIFNFQIWRKKHHFWGFWHHRFAKAKTLRFIFLGDFLPRIYTIRDVQLFQQLKNVEVQRNIIYPKDDFIIKLAEPCTGGCLTLNGYEDLQRYNCITPDYHIKNVMKDFTSKNQVKAKRMVEEADRYVE